ncbi:MAG: PDZ domain-containing protein [Cyclobacteriaceae bacterium]
MKKFLIVSVLLTIFLARTSAQTHNEYVISFENAVHHEARVEAKFSNLENKVLSLRMSRTSPGRYAIHDFAKNVYNVTAVDGDGNDLPITRPNPQQWDVSGHNGEVVFTYTLFANRGGGTYAQIDETHAHLNIPATFVYAPALSQRPVKVTFKVREDLKWKIATQLKNVSETTYFAPDLHYFMDSPTELSNHSVREFPVESNGKTYRVQFALHHNGTETEFDQYWENTKKVVLQEMAVYGEMPDFDFGSYVFLGCYIPNASGDGMEHRNSTILTSKNSLAGGGMEGNIGTVSHEFFHAWNVERIRPLSLEPFNYEEANMSGELWFAEGFTSYYTRLILCRAGIITEQEYIEGLSGGLNYVWNSPATKYRNPIEMSYQAPFVDAATSVDPVNRENYFISYYTYGSVLGLALDLSLRNLGTDLTMDGYMKAVWEKYGKPEIPYTVRDVENVLMEYAGADFGSTFYAKYIYSSEMPDYASLLAQVGVVFKKANPDNPYFGAATKVGDGKVTLLTNSPEGSPSYLAGLASGDVILSVDGKSLDKVDQFSDFLKGNYKVGDKAEISFTRFGEEMKTTITFAGSPNYTTYIKKGDKSAEKMRVDWLGDK